MKLGKEWLLRTEEGKTRTSGDVFVCYLSCIDVVSFFTWTPAYLLHDKHRVWANWYHVSSHGHKHKTQDLALIQLSWLVRFYPHPYPNLHWWCATDLEGLLWCYCIGLNEKTKRACLLQVLNGTSKCEELQTDFWKNLDPGRQADHLNLLPHQMIVSKALHHLTFLKQDEIWFFFSSAADSWHNVHVIWNLETKQQQSIK